MCFFLAKKKNGVRCHVAICLQDRTPSSERMRRRISKRKMATQKRWVKDIWGSTSFFLEKKKGCGDKGVVVKHVLCTHTHTIQDSKSS